MEEDGAWAEAAAEGFAIAAIVHGDPGAARAEAGLTPAARPSATQVARQLATLPPAERRAFLRSRLARPPLDLEALANAPARVRAALAFEVERDLGRRWLGEAMPRAGYAADPSLIGLLRALASVRDDRRSTP